MSDGLVVTGVRHFCPVMMMQAIAMGLEETLGTGDEGFVDNRGTYLTREEAYDVAELAGQLNYRFAKTGNPNIRRLYSEDLY